jgi:hypothetical protein
VHAATGKFAALVRSWSDESTTTNDDASGEHVYTHARTHARTHSYTRSTSIDPIPYVAPPPTTTAAAAAALKREVSKKVSESV